MKLNCNRDQLTEAINAVQRGVALKSTNPVLQSILFTAENQELCITATNTEISIRVIIPAEIETTGSFLLNAGFISEMIRKLTGDMVFFESIGSLQIKVECLLSNFTINGLHTEEFPMFPVIDEEYAIKVKADVFKMLIHRTIFSVATNDSIPVLTGIKLEISNQQMTLISLDGYRLSYCCSEIEKEQNDVFSVIIPGKSMQELDRILTGRTEDIHIRFSKTQVLFEIGNIQFASRLLEGEFINYKNIIPSEFASEVQIERNVLLGSSERAALLAKEGKNNLIILDFSTDRLELTSSADIGEAKEIIPIHLTGNDLKIAFNSKYIIDALRVIDDEKITMKMTTSVGPSVIVSEKGTGDYIFLILPVRIAETL